MTYQRTDHVRGKPRSPLCKAFGDTLSDILSVRKGFGSTHALENTR